MANIGKIFGITALIAGLVAASYKGVSFYNKVKQASGNITFGVSFLRVHGLVGEGITKFLSPTIRTLFNLNLKNFSGFNVDVTKIFARIETNKSGATTWDAIATTTDYLAINLKDATQINKTLTFDFKGTGTISSLINKKNRHRIVLTYNYKGQQLQFIQDVDLAGPINSFWQKVKGGTNSLKGTNAINTINLLA